MFGSVSSRPPPSPVKSASPPVKSASSFSEPVRANDRSFSTLKLALGHWFSGKSSLVFCTPDIDARSLSHQAIWPPRPTLDETAKKCYDEIIVTGLPSPWTQIFEEGAGKNNTLIAPAASEGTPAGPAAVGTTSTEASSAQPGTSVSNAVAPTLTELGPAHTGSMLCTSVLAPTTLIGSDPPVEPAAAQPTGFESSFAKTVYFEPEVEESAPSDCEEGVQEFETIIKICPVKPTDSESPQGKNWRLGHCTPAELAHIRAANARAAAEAATSVPTGHEVGVPTANAVPSHTTNEGKEHGESSDTECTLVLTAVEAIFSSIMTTLDEVEQDVQWTRLRAAERIRWLWTTRRQTRTDPGI
ncbi:hypothetical protein FRC10_011871 [Ceratobasidium sp. 414]|nr:hypothetical protein FRC10_011871 [Ceratobasidium sp. 414]